MSFTTFFGDRFDLVSVALPRVFGPLTPEAVSAFEQRVGWVELPGGQVLFRQGDESDSLFIVAGGRLQAIVEAADGGARVVGEIARGESVGEMALLTGQPHTATVVALRDTLLMRLDRAVFDELARRFPGILRAISREAIVRLQGEGPRDRSRQRITNVSLIPVARDVAVRDAAQHLESCLTSFGSTTRLSADEVDRRTGVPGLASCPDDGHDHARLTTWLDHQSLLHRFVIYEGSYDPSPWTSRCIRQADRVLLVASADGRPGPSLLERALFSDTPEIGSVPCELVLLHRSGTVTPGRAADWYHHRRIIRHHHVRLDRDGDWKRLARFLAGAAVGIVFAGGGARGFAHIGVVRAIREAGIPIDMAGGTSMGAVIAAGVASDWDQDGLYEKNRRAFTAGHPLGDYNLLPTVSLLKGRRIDLLLRNNFGDLSIEDLWLPFFCVSSNLSRASMTVHRRGAVWKAVRASLSIPGILPPVVYGDDLHVDGATFNNLPVDVMHASGAGRIIAADIDVHKGRDLGYTEIPSSWEVFTSRVLPGRKAVRAPGMVNTVFQASFLGGGHQRPAARRADLYLNPDVAHVKLLDFSAFDDTVEAGYRHARERLTGVDIGPLVDATS
jgi:predicted acylesterase/phospholipase RssA